VRNLTQIDRTGFAAPAARSHGDGAVRQIVCAALVLAIVAITLRLAAVW